MRALHPDPSPVFAYINASAAGDLGLAGAANQVVVVPSEDVDELRRELFDLDEVPAIKPACSFADALDGALEQFTGILRVIEVATLLLALLIAFNSAGVSADGEPASTPPCMPSACRRGRAGHGGGQTPSSASSAPCWGSPGAGSGSATSSTASSR